MSAFMKKKFWLLSGAFKNAGDFLIRDRSIQLLKKVYPDCDIVVWNRNRSIDEVLDEVNQCDAVIFAGGPVYTKDMYPCGIPLVEDLSKIKVKICEMGLGWWNKTVSDEDILNFRFDDSMKELLVRMENDMGELSCREWMSATVLKNNGFKKVVMTGCPAWYSEMARSFRVYQDIKDIKKICISDSAYYKNHEQIVMLVKYVKEKFTNAEINFLFHRGISSDEYTNEVVGEKNNELKAKLQELNYVTIYDLSYSLDGLSVYDDCDLHIGYRVHAHIYNISIHNFSILIEEDSRGVATNQTLGTFSLPARVMAETEISNPNYISILDSYIDLMFDNNFSVYKAAFSTLEIYKQKMIDHIEKFVNE